MDGYTNNCASIAGKTICTDKWVCGKLIEFALQPLTFCRNISIHNP